VTLETWHNWGSDSIKGARTNRSHPLTTRFPVTHDATSGYQTDTEIQVETDSGG